MPQAFLKQLTHRLEPPHSDCLSEEASGLQLAWPRGGELNAKNGLDDHGQSQYGASEQDWQRRWRLGRKARQRGESHASGLFAQWHLLSPGEPVVMGRDPRCVIAIDNELYPVVSREHAVVRAVPPQQDAGRLTAYGAERNAELNDVGPGSSVVSGSAEGSEAELNRVLHSKASSQDDEMRWQLCDLGSANGTYVNGHRLWGCQILEVGDRLQLGKSGPIFCFEYQVSSAPVAKASLASSPEATGSQPVTLSQLFPLISTGSDLTRKAYLIPGVITVGVVVSLFLTVGQPRWFNGLLASYLSFGAYYYVYRLCGKAKPWWLPLLTAGLTIALLSTPLLDASLWLFREVLPGAMPTEAEALPMPLLFTRMLVGAGLMEELLKILPLGILAGLARISPPPWRDRLGIWEPLDGILLGAASAVGFTLLETLGQYVPYMTQMSLGTGIEAGQLAGLQLLIPRLLGSVSGHIAYSGYFGYFIGLSVMLPQRRWLILGVGCGTASLLHALWNVVGSYSALLLAAVGILSYACLVAAILKARSLSPNRAKNFATRFSNK